MEDYTSYRLSREMKLKDGTAHKVGSRACIRFEGTQAVLNFGTGEFKIKAKHLPTYFADNFFMPTDEQLEEWVYDGVCESVRGETVEPDGFDSEGSPSWLVALGLI
jgi:hypothetical protein